MVLPIQLIVLAVLIVWRSSVRTYDGKFALFDKE